METTVQFRRADQPPAGPANGTQAVAGLVIAMVGAVAAANPQCAVIRAVNDAAPQLAVAVPALVTACGAIIAAFSHPPRLVGGK